jgi:hypothetical protein
VRAVALVLACCACLIAPAGALASARSGVLAHAGWSARAPVGGAQATERLAREPVYADLAEVSPLVAMAPVVTTLPAISLSREEVVLLGVINPEGEHTKFRFKASLASSEWCLSAGASGKPIATSPLFELVPEDETGHEVAVLLTAEQRDICFEIEAENATGTAAGKQRFYQMGSPTAITGTATSVGPLSATIDGKVEGASQRTSYELNAALLTSTWCESAGESGAPEETTGELELGSEDGEFHAVEATLRGLKTNTAYCAKLRAVNGSGVSVGNETTFKTPKVPYALTTSAASTGTATAVVHGEIDPEGESAEYEAEYEKASSEWCRSEGVRGAAQASAPVQLAQSDETLHAVEVELSGLAPGTEYCAALVALGSKPSHADGRQFRFTTSPLPRLEVLFNGIVAGSVNGSGISCPGTCAASYQPGTHVVLTASPDAGFKFSGWGGACAGSGSCEVVMSSNMHVTVTFAALPGPPVVNPPIGPPLVGPPTPLAVLPSPQAPTCDLSPGAGSHVRLARTKKPKPGKSGFDRVAVSVSCDQSARVTLDAVVIETHKSAKHGSHSQRETLASVSGSVGGGETGTLVLHIPAAIVRALYGGVSERLSLSLHASGSGGTRSSSAALPLIKGR